MKNTHKVSSGSYQEGFKSIKVPNTRTKHFNNVCLIIPLLTWPECVERSDRWHYTFMMITYLLCQAYPITMPGSYPDSKQG